MTARVDRVFCRICTEISLSVVEELSLFRFRRRYRGRWVWEDGQTYEFLLILVSQITRGNLRYGWGAVVGRTPVICSDSSQSRRAAASSSAGFGIGTGTGRCPATA